MSTWVSFLFPHQTVRQMTITICWAAMRALQICAFIQATEASFCSSRDTVKRRATVSAGTTPGVTYYVQATQALYTMG